MNWTPEYLLPNKDEGLDLLNDSVSSTEVLRIDNLRRDREFQLDDETWKVLDELQDKWSSLAQPSIVHVEKVEEKKLEKIELFDCSGLDLEVSQPETAVDEDSRTRSIRKPFEIIERDEKKEKKEKKEKEKKEESKDKLERSQKPRKMVHKTKK